MNFKNQIFVVRHGKAQNNELGVSSCKLETQNKHGLTEEGEIAVQFEAENYTDFDIIYCSPFRRTRETADFFAKTSGCDVIADERLQEFDVGDLDGKSYEIISAIKSQHDDPDYIYLNGESRNQVLERLVSFLQEIDDKHYGKKILVVSHGSPTEIMLDWVAGKPIKKWAKCIAKGKVFSLI